jgi:predicted DNA-binding transcriptional regulator YafY
MIPCGMTTAPPDSARAPRWSIERRLALLLARLQWEGRVNRGDLVQRFGISPNQATADLKRFSEVYPGALVYDAKEKTYRAGPSLPQAMPDDAARLLRDLRLVAEGVLPGDEIALATIPLLAAADAPSRTVDPTVLHAVLAAIRTRAVVRAAYQSFSSPKPQQRRIEPHALVFDGFRWHARSRDADDGAYKDFVLGRLAKPRVDDPETAEPVHDVDWRTNVELDIRPHPALTPSQRHAVESDYGMVGGRVVLRCRKAVVYYTKRRLGLTLGHEKRDATDQHIILKRETARPEL